ncbi:hypothetical protein [Glutamicibacter sp. NPDC087344]|uniref:hypothetical protein n=1 Tax=Glutamicibacter sp. NPDC087344 TaxID=3363994 RepID=UPI0037F25EA3
MSIPTARGSLTDLAIPPGSPVDLRAIPDPESDARSGSTSVFLPECSGARHPSGSRA